MSQELGTFTPYQYSGNNKDNKGSRMAGDMLNDFAKGNVAQVLGANKDYRKGVSNEDSAYQPTVDNASNSKDPKVSASSPAPQASASPPASQSGSGWTDGSGKAIKKEPTAEEKARSAAARAAQQQQAQDNLNNRAAELTASYDPNKYKYYESDFGSGTGAEAYGKDMANYESWVERNQSGPGAGHLGLVAETMHPDWGRSQRTGGGNKIVEQNYSQAPTGAAYGRGGKKEGVFGGGSQVGQPKGKY